MNWAPASAGVSGGKQMHPSQPFARPPGAVIRTAEALMVMPV